MKRTTPALGRHAVVQRKPLHRTARRRRSRCRERFGNQCGKGLIYAFRRLSPSAAGYTFWDYRRSRWERDAGLRLDYVLLSDLAALGLQDTGVARDMRGADNPSNHAPLWVDLV